MSSHILWHDESVSKKERRKLNQHSSGVLWFTGLSGSGKSTLANAVDRTLYEKGIRSFVFDGDNIRHGLNRGLGFSAEERQENIRRIGEVSKLFVESGQFALTAFISPYREDRNNVRALMEDDEFIEIYVRCALTECERRDPKGLYQKARAGEIPEFTGISAPYEEPVQPELIIDTDILTVDESVSKILRFLEERQQISRMEGRKNGLSKTLGNRREVK